MGRKKSILYTKENFKTTIQLPNFTRNRLKKYGEKGETFNDIIIKFMNLWDKSTKT